jgi:hypothetical protein
VAWQKHPLPGQSEFVEHGLAHVPLLSVTQAAAHTPFVQTGVVLPVAQHVNEA